MRTLLVVMGLVLSAIPCPAKTIAVDDDGGADSSTIQAAIDAAESGDIILVAPGTYIEKIVFGSVPITLTSENPDDPVVVQSTVISASSDYSVTLGPGHGNDTVLSGLTITGRGILCNGAAPTISNNVIINCSNRGIQGQNSAAPVIRANTITSNQQEGVYFCNGPIEGNQISGNSIGIAFSLGAIRGNVISGNVNNNPGLGGGLHFCDGPIEGNSIIGNYAASHGGGLYDCAGEIRNNIIAGNQAVVAGGGLHHCSSTIVNNTIVGNVAGETGGGLSQCAGPIHNNIIAFNGAGEGGGIYGGGANAYNCLWSNAGGDFGGGAVEGIGVLAADPAFATNGYWDHNGTPEIDDDLWINGDYHLQSMGGRWNALPRTWVSDPDTSACVDGGDPAVDLGDELPPNGLRLNLGAYGGTTQASMSSATPGEIADLDGDGGVGYTDLMIVCEKWVSPEAPIAEDITRDGFVDGKDIALLCSRWGPAPPEPAPPMPNPMTWPAQPFTVGPTWIEMVATTAVSTDRTGVEYFFQDFANRERNSGWISFDPGLEPQWRDTGLTPNHGYIYRVKARNVGNQLETGWSIERLAETLPEDSIPPTPNPATWETEPYASGPGTIRMVATEATDPCGVQYLFECRSHPVYSSPWRDSREYEVTSLPDGQYSFTVRYRDKSAGQNQGDRSIPVSVDLTPPTPNPMQWAIPPTKINIGGGTFSWYATMRAVEATDDADGVQYYFQCVSDARFSSGWQDSRDYTVLVGRKELISLFRVKARDTSPGLNETGWSSTLPAD